MADAALGATIQVVLETVLSLANDRIGQFLGFKEELERLSKTAERIQGFVADADDKKHSPGVLRWLKDLEGEVFRAENVLDEVNYENLRREVKYQSQLKQKVCFFFSVSSTIGFRLKMASKIRDINANLKGMNQEANELGLVTRFHIEAALSAVPATVGATASRQTDSLAVSNVVGRAKDESEIVARLLSPSDKLVSVIPIVGMGGLGKTTLAKSVYNHPQIRGRFDQKIWVCVAKKIEILELFKFILESLTKDKVEVDRRDTVIQKIQEKLERKRYLLVLDDVWNHQQGLWNDFFTTLEGLNATSGSWCLITTRLQQVADIVSRHLKMNVSTYELGKLSDDECWSILKGKVVAGEQVPNELEAIKRQILRRCAGVPLSAILIGGLLLNKEKEEWRFIVEGSLLNVDQDDVKQIIKVSFDHLPSTSVKKCFVYCSLFPQDTELDKDLLIELWMAEGFLQPDSRNERLMEATGDNYFRILLHSSLLLEEVNEWGETCYIMHDLVHDFAKSALNEDRYLALISSRGTAKDIIKKNSTSLRTLFLEGSISGDILSRLECLHVLILIGEEVEVLPDSIGKLIHLRFLGIFSSEITILPQSLRGLYNLQTLGIENDKLRRGLPKQMSNLISLRHLHYYDSRADFQMPLEMGRLTHLQTLRFFNVGQEDGRGIEELGNLKDLKGSLEIRNIELVNGEEAAKGAKLFEKENLSELKYLWASWGRESDNCDEDVLEGLRPHQNLQKLEIRNFMGDHFPGWFIKLSTLVELKFTDCKRCRELPALGQLPFLERLELIGLEKVSSIGLIKFPALVELKLIDCKKYRELPALGQLQSLERLELIGLENVSSIGLSFYGISGGGQVRKFFPALKYLFLCEMENLAEWKGEEEVKTTTGAAEVDLFPILETLHIENCSQLTSAPSHFPSVEELDIGGNCHVSLLKAIVSSIINLSSLELSGNTLPDPHSDEHIKRLRLVKRRHSNNLEEDVGYGLCLSDCGSVPSEMLEHLCQLPSIRYLKLINFSNPTRLMGQESFVNTSIERLKIDVCHGLTCLPVFTSIKQLEIYDCSGLTRLPGEMLASCASLQILMVCTCPNLVSFPHDLRRTPALEILNLSYCPKLMIADMPKGFAFLTGLRELLIGPFPINETTEFEFDWSGLISSSSSTLTSLSFNGSPSHVESLPEQLQYLTSLTELSLIGFGIEALPDWIGNFASLQQLELWKCKKLRDLPSMAARGRLTELKSLQISGCPLLEERWNPQSGTDSQWPMIL